MSVPALRFREFSGDWDLYPLKDRIDFLAGYAFDSKLMSAEKSIFQLIKMSNVYQGELSLDRNPAYWGELDNGTRKFLLKKGDVVLTLTGTVGKKDYGYSVDICNGQVKQDTLLSRLFIKFPLILNRGLIA